MNSPVTVTISTPAKAHPAQSAAPRRASAFDLVAAQPWAITPAALETISAIARREGEGVEAVEAKLGRPLQNTRSVSMRGSVAVVPVTGPIFRYANLFTEISGATSLDVLATDFTKANEDPAVTAIVLNMDSPGGQAAGISEFAQMVRSANKPVIAYVDGNAASAAYWIAAAASEIVVSKTGMVGSIGAVLTIDTSRSQGEAIEIVSSQSPKKRPDVTTDAGRAQIQSLVDRLAQVFVEDVAAYRGVGADRVLSDFGQGDMRIGSDAVDAGMADRISTLEEVLARLAAGNSTRQGVNMTSTSGPQAATKTEMPAITAEFLAANHADLVAGFRAEGAIAERERIQSVEAQALPGHEALIASLKFDGKTTGPEAAVAVLSAERLVASDRAKSFYADAPAAVPHAAAPGDDASAGLSVEEQARADWEKSANLRAEFGAIDTYLAYAKAQAAGSVKVLSKK